MSQSSQSPPKKILGSFSDKKSIYKTFISIRVIQNDNIKCIVFTSITKTKGILLLYISLYQTQILQFDCPA